LGVILGGIFSRFIPIPFVGGFMPLIIAFAVGLLTAEAISRATGYKRGVGLQAVSAICVVFGYFIGNALLFVGWLNFYTIIYLLLAILAAVGRLR